MKKYLVILTCTILILTIFAVLSTAQDKEKAKPKYVGLSSCKACHSKAEIGGTEYLDYEKDPHAKAFETLSSAESKEIADKMGIKDATKDAKCLKCHATAYGLTAQHDAKFKYDEGVTCEACHGPGEKYRSMPIMKDHQKCLENGLVIPDAKLCITCHNSESPTYKPFDFEKKWKIIEHGKKKDAKAAK
jgi:hypothetical protein